MKIKELTIKQFNDILSNMTNDTWNGTSHKLTDGIELIASPNYVPTLEHDIELNDLRKTMEIHEFCSRKSDYSKYETELTIFAIVFGYRVDGFKVRKNENQKFVITDEQAKLFLDNIIEQLLKVKKQLNSII